MNSLEELLIVVFICLLTISCTSKSLRSESDVIRINLFQDYQEREIDLNDIADIQYISMDVDENYLFKGSPRYLSENLVIFYNTSDGSFLFFTKEGKPKSKFNHKGGGPGEYPSCSRVLYEEKKDDLFVLTPGKIIIYSSLGDLKRELTLPENMTISDIVNFDDKSLLLYDSNDFIVFSKEDGAELKRFKLSSGEKVRLYAMQEKGESVSIIASIKNHIVRYDDGFLLTDYNTDTVFYCNRDFPITPILVKDPSIHEMDPVVYLNSFVESGDYLFFRKVTVKVENNKLPSIYLFKDKHNGLIYEQKIVIQDFEGKQLCIAPETISKTAHAKQGYIELDFEELRDAYENNLLHGQLKELVESLVSKSDANNVYMLITFR